MDEHSHSHASSAPPVRQVESASVLASSALSRLLVAGALSAALWCGVWWALRA